jgi:hypothetical protein
MCITHAGTGWASSLRVFPPDFGLFFGVDFFFFRRHLSKKTADIVADIVTLGTALDVAIPQPLLACMVAVTLRH